MAKNKKVKAFLQCMSLAALMVPGSMLPFDGKPAATFSPNWESQVLQIDMESLRLDSQQMQDAKAFNQGLVAELKTNINPDEITAESLDSKNNSFDRIISDYCKSHDDAASAAIYDQIVNKAAATVLPLDLDKESPVYRSLSRHYKINDKMDITITPDAIYVDEFAEESTAPQAAEPAGKQPWNYKQYAARRTLICKRISGGRISPGKVYFVHTGGEIKYNRSKAVHSSGYYGYAQAGESELQDSFKQIVSQSESCRGTGWHYKYFGHVTGGSQLGTAISERLSYKEQPLGCEVVIDKNGAAAANYWPKL